MQGLKHLVNCRCILQQFKLRKNPPSHCFVVFSIIGDDNKVIPKHTQCNNCGIIHKIVDICKSEILEGKEQAKSIVTLDDIKFSLHPNFAGVLESNSADIATWEYVKFLVDNKMWGSSVVLASETENDSRTGKILIVLGEALLKVESFSREESFDGS